MASGFFGGILVGTVVSGLGICVVSLLAGLPGARPPEAVVLKIPAESEFNQPRVDVWAELSGVERSPDPSGISQIDAPALGDLKAVSSGVTETAAKPSTGRDASALILPVDVEESTGVRVLSSADNLVLQRPVVVPAVPETESALLITTGPAALPMLNDPKLSDTGNPVQTVDMHASTATILAELLDLPQGPSAGNWEQSLSQDSTVLNIPRVAPVQPMLRQVSVADQTLPLKQGMATDAQNQAVASIASSGPIVEIGHELAPGAVISDASPSDGQAAPLGVVQEVDTLKTQGETLPNTGGLENLTPDVITNRLPSVTDTPEVVENTSKADTAEGVETENLPQLERFAVEFENPDAKPLMAIILIDDGTNQIDLEKLKSFPYPLSFAIDTKWPGAAKAMRTYRDAGFEVLAMADLPKSAGAADTEVTMAIYLRAVPEAVAVMEGVGEGLQAGRKASTQLAQILAANGLGAVMLPKGLNTVEKLIAREGVPAITVFRDFDAKGEGAPMIQRYLDRAVMKAGQEENGVIMVGRLRAETINALIVWALGDRAARVALAPVSAVLRGR